MQEYLKLLIKFIKKNYIIILLFSSYISITYLFKIPNCITKVIFGLPCPACGMTRAGFSVLRLDFKSAIFFNPCIFLFPIVCWVIVFKEKKLEGKLYKSKIFWSIILTLLLGTYLIRMFTVYPNYPLDYYQDNIISKIIEQIKNIRG